MASSKHAIREKCHRLPLECYRGMVTVAFTACVEHKYSLFTQAEVVSASVERLGTAVEKHSCLVLIYCFMPEHLHLIVRGKGSRADTWRAMVDFKQQTGFWLAQRRSPGTWQKDFYDHIVRADEDLGAQIRYIANNPVRRGIVGDWRDYPFTGAIGVDLNEVMADTATL